ncbi:hypothetical protein AC622_12255 [Bacillus sp. FJAT-27916]|uniref:hypothetical protein n=1 Tax=Bacillaceae TaxID=186817 RepID=UPI000670D4E8|nr:hypothetical protein [Bacillus sp. FJAT-27916]KMY44894.1 hypothetical protein AC622_12255 [Bacillus sp. FJAT-27916]
MRSNKMYNQIMNELRINYQNYYDFHTISMNDFNKRRTSLILRLRTAAHENEAQMSKQQQG